MKKSVFIIGAKGIPAKYGGFESFVEQLTGRQVSKKIEYFVACRRDLSENKSNEFEYNGATCFNVAVPNVGPAKAVLYDVLAFKKVLKIIKERQIQEPIVYVLACRMGPFIGGFKRKLQFSHGKLFVSPDGHEWKRAKWSLPVRKYWKASERLMVKHADLLICDSKNIEKYIHEDYGRYNPQTTYISYGSDESESTVTMSVPKVKDWFAKYGVKQNKYFLIVGRFVPENNYETMIREFMKSPTKKDLIIISNVEKNRFYDTLEKVTHFSEDKRIKFVGTVYDSQLLKYIRENAFAYIHGHEVGGTNPSLLEALASTKLNLLLKVGFNEEVGGNGALYWNKNDLSKVINHAELLSDQEIESLNLKSTARIKNYFSWNKIINEYEQEFLEES